MRYTSVDGLMSGSDPTAVATWDRIGDEMAQEQRDAAALLRSEGVKAAHPDDGWVDRARGRIHFCYPTFDDGVAVGDTIALGWPWDGYRLVRVTHVEQGGILAPMTWYHFEDTGRRIPSQRTGSVEA